MEHTIQLLKDYWSTVLALGAVAGTVGGWYLTYYGWHRSYLSNVEVEREKYRNSVEIERRKSELAFINDQIRYLYGPLVALNNAASQAFWSFRQQFAEGRDAGILLFREGVSVEEGIRQWRLWMREIIMPLNLRMEEIITTNAHLMTGRGMPGTFLEFLAHVETYKAVVKNWDYVPIESVAELSMSDRLRMHTSVINFPDQFQHEIEEVFATLKARQQVLLSASSAISLPAAELPPDLRPVAGAMVDDAEKITRRQPGPAGSGNLDDRIGYGRAINAVLSARLSSTAPSRKPRPGPRQPS